MMDAFSQRLVAPATLQEFAAGLEQACRDAGFEHYLAMVFADDELTQLQQVIHNGPVEAREHLQQAAHWSVGRLVDHMRLARLPVHFGEDAPMGLELPGYRSGVAYLARQRRGGLLLVFGAEAKALDLAAMVFMVGQVTLTAHCGLQGLATLEVRQCPFTAKELECLQLALAGLSSKETAQQLGISRRTVEHHLASARKRCAVGTTMAAAYFAVGQGWLEMAQPAAEATG